MDFTITISDEDTEVIKYILAAQQKAEENAPKDEADLVQKAFDGNILTPWRALYEQQKVVNIQATLDNANPEVKASAVAALVALQNATPEQQIAVLDQLTAGLSGLSASAAPSAVAPIESKVAKA